MRELGGDSPTKYGWLVEVVVEGWSFETFVNVGIERGGGAWKATVDTLTSFLSWRLLIDDVDQVKKNKEVSH